MDSKSYLEKLKSSLLGDLSKCKSHIEFEVDYASKFLYTADDIVKAWNDFEVYADGVESGEIKTISTINKEPPLQRPTLTVERLIRKLEKNKENKD